MQYFAYTNKETDYLSKKDKKLAEAIKRIGKIERVVEPDLFVALMDSIVSQQISNKAADTVWKKLVALVGEVTQERIIAASLEDIQKCGMSFRKAEYLHAAAKSGIDFDKLESKPDDEFIEELTKIKGVGEWTAEMLLIFSLERPNVVSYKDLAIRRGMQALYGHKELTKEQFARYKKRYSPYGTVASLYLWELSHEGE